VRTIDVGYTTFARMKRDELIVNKVQPGDVIVGIASHGQASYETEYNGGMGSNGLTSARHDVFNKIYAEKYPDSYDHNTPDEVVFVGNKKLGKLVLSPTRTFMPLLNEVFKTLKKEINGIIHCTGGAQTKVLKFVDNVHIIKDNLFDTPPLFELIQRESHTDWKEMYQVFNMGNRLEFYLPEQHAQTIIDVAKSFNIDAQIIGRVIPSKTNQLTIKSPYGTFEYNE